MPNKIINVPTVGPVNFPDTMSDQDISQAIQKNYPHLRPPSPDAGQTQVKQPSMVDRASSRLLNTVVGPGTLLGDAMYPNLAPNADEFKRQALTSGFAANKPGIARDMISPAIQGANIMNPGEQYSHPVLTGGLQTASGLTSPENVLLMAGTAGTSGVASKLLGGAFSLQLAASAADAGYHAYKSAALGNKSEAERYGTIAVLSGGMSALGATHLLGKDTPLATAQTAQNLHPQVPELPENRPVTTAKQPEISSQKVGAPTAGTPADTRIADYNDLQKRLQKIIDDPKTPTDKLNQAKGMLAQVGQLQSGVSKQTEPTAGEKQAKIEGSDITAKRPEWTRQQYIDIQQKAKAIIAHPEAKPEDIQTANDWLTMAHEGLASMDKDFQRGVSTVEAAKQNGPPITGPQASQLKPGEELPRSTTPIKTPLPKAGSPKDVALRAGYNYLGPQEGTGIHYIADPNFPDHPLGITEAKLTPELVKPTMDQHLASFGLKTEETVPAEAIPKVEKSLEVPVELRAALDRGKFAKDQLSRTDLTDAQRTGYTGAIDALRQTANQALTKWKNYLYPDKIGEAADSLRAANEALQPKVDYLEKHLEQRPKIAEQRAFQANEMRIGGESGARRTGNMHVPKDEFGQPLVNEQGEPLDVSGHTTQAREALGALFGDRRVDVPNAGAKIKGPLPEHLAPLQTEIDELKADIKSGKMEPEYQHDALGQISDNERQIAEYYQAQTKTSKSPTKEQVAQQRGIPTSEVQTTGAGKATTIDLERPLAVMTSAIWENEYGGGKGSKWDDEGILRNKLDDLKTQQKQNEVFSNYLDKNIPRASEAGAISRPLLGGIAGGATGAAVGAAVGGPFGAAIGGIAGAWTGAVASSPHLGAELAKLRMDADISVDKSMDWIKRWIDPVNGNPAVSDPMFKMKAEVEKADNHARQAFEAFRNEGMRLPQSEQIKFVDAVKTGNLSQLSPEWRQYADLRRVKDDDVYDRMNLAIEERRKATGTPFSPTAYLNNHMRVMWKDLPGSAKGEIEAARSSGLYGTKGMLKQHALADMSTGVANGGVPWSWNPVENDLLSWHDAERFIQGTKLTTHMIENNFAEFVPTGARPKISDMTRTEGTNMQVYFPAASGEGLIKAGEWYVDKNYARMLDNYTSPDRIRANALGRGFLGYRAAVGQLALFGPFHALAMNFVAQGSDTGIGIRNTWEGLKNSDSAQIVKGLRDLATSSVASFKDFSLGQKLKTGDFDPQFWQTPAGMKLQKAYPGSEHMLDLLWQGGAKNAFAIDEDMRNKFHESFTQNWANAMDNFAKGNNLTATSQVAKTAMTAPFAALRMAMAPLFETFIPSMKLGIMFRDMDASLSERAGDIVAGKTTEAKVARDVVRRVEDFAGEYNIDNLFLNKTFRSTLTTYYRSFGWRFGTMQSLGHSLIEQPKELIAAAREGRAPRLNGDVATWMGLAAYTTIASAVAMKMLTGKNPQNITDVLHPQTGVKDDRGKPLRFDWPNYLSRDIPSIARNPGGYVVGGVSDLSQHIMEAWTNRRFDSGYVADPHDNSYKGFAWRVGHALVPTESWYPGTFMQENVQRMSESGLGKKQAWGLIAMGAGVSSRQVGLTSAEMEAQRLGSGRTPEGPFSDSVLARRSAIKQMTTAIVNDRDPGDIFEQHLKDGTIQPDDLDTAFNHAATPYIVQETSRLNLEDTISVYKKGTPEEKEALQPILLQKMDNLDKITDPVQRQRLMDQLDQILQ